MASALSRRISQVEKKVAESHPTYQASIEKTQALEIARYEVKAAQLLINVAKRRGESNFRHEAEVLTCRLREAKAGLARLNAESGLSEEDNKPLG